MSKRSTSSLTTLSGFDALVPDTIATLDIRKLPLGPEEAFVWTRVDGHSNVKEICFTTGLAPERVIAALQRLLDVGALKPLPGFTQSTPKPVPNPSKPDFAQTKVVAAKPKETAQPIVNPQTTDGAAPDSGPKTLAERVLVLSAQYSGNHYQVLGVARKAERAAIKDAYFTRVAEVHPDKFYGLELGEHKATLEQLFRRLTLAHDTLTRAKLRGEYDATLPAEEAPALAEALDAKAVSPSAPSNKAAEREVIKQTRCASEPARAQKPVSSRPRAPGSNRRHDVASNSLNPDSGPVSSGAPSSQPISSNASGRPSVAPVSVTLRPRKPPARPGLPSGSIPPPPSVQPRHTPRTSSGAPRGPALVPAADALRIASSLLTSTPGFVQINEAANHTPDGSDKLAQQSVVLAAARDARARSDYSTALRHYTELINLQPEPAVLREAAQCATSGQLPQKAAEILRKALTVEPSAADLHIWLGSIYASAGMLESAKSEFQRALALNPKDDQSRQWLKRIERGDVRSL